MRRTVSFILLVLGLFFIALAPLLHFYTYPRVLKAPLDIYTTSRNAGTGSYFSLKTLGVVGPVKLVNLATARGDVKAGSPTVAAYDYFSTTEDATNGNGVIDASNQRYTFDRVTGDTVHCCGEHPRHSGLTLKFPFNVQKRSYSFWDMTSERAFPAVFAGEQTVDGLRTYHFVQQVSRTIIGQIEVSKAVAQEAGTGRTFIFVVYAAITNLYVDPYTGAIVKGGQHAIRTAVNGAGTILFTVADTDLTNDEATIRSTVDLVKSKSAQLKLVRVVLPVAGPVLGLILILVGLLLARRRAAPKTATPDEAAVAPTG